LTRADDVAGASDSRRGDALAVASAIFAAVYLIAFRAATAAAPRDAAVLAMLACATALNAGFALGLARNKPRAPSRVTVVSVLVLAVLTILGNIGVAGALAHLDPGMTSTLLQTQVFVVGVGGWLFLGERITGRFVVGAGFALGGFAVLGGHAPAAAAVDPTGVAFALLGSVSFGAMLLFTRKVVTRIDPVGVNVARLALAVAMMAAWLGPTGEIARVPRGAWLMTGVAAACGPFISRLFVMYAVRNINASRAKLLTLLTPVVAFGLEALLFGTVPHRRELAGAGLILAGVLLPILASGGSNRAGV
jgi:drug/metabolite transporter (DMT)-like permease